MSDFPSDLEFRDPDLGPRRGPGPIVLVLPLLVFVCALLWMRHGRDRDGGERPAPPGGDAGLEVAGWQGGVASIPGAHLDVQLVPLHADARRQAFDRDALARQLSTGEGEPWQLVLRYEAQPDAAAADLSLDPVLVRDDAGARLRPLVADAPLPEDGRAADPLRALLAPPAASLAPGETLTIVLWGPAPEAGARLELGALRCSLTSTRIASTAVPRTLAVLDRGGER